LNFAYGWSLSMEATEFVPHFLAPAIITAGAHLPFRNLLHFCGHGTTGILSVPKLGGIVTRGGPLIESPSGRVIGIFIVVRGGAGVGIGRQHKDDIISRILSIGAVVDFRVKSRRTERHVHDCLLTCGAKSVHALFPSCCLGARNGAKLSAPLQLDDSTSRV
jgi:hypothetical protein